MGIHFKRQENGHALGGRLGMAGSLSRFLRFFFSDLVACVFSASVACVFSASVACVFSASVACAPMGFPVATSNLHWPKQDRGGKQHDHCNTAQKTRTKHKRT